MKDAALDLVIAALEQIRETSDRLPRASRSALAGLQSDMLEFGSPSLPAVASAEGGGRVDAHFAPWFDQTFPTHRAKAFEKQELNHTIIGESSSRQDTRIVQNKHIARSQECFQFAKLPMLNCLLGTM